MNAPATLESVSEFAREELTGKLLAVCVSQLGKLVTPWNMTPEAKQQIALGAMEEAISNAVRGCVKVIVTDRKPAILATVESVTFKDGVKTVMSLSKGAPGVHDLADAEGGTVAIIIAPTSYTEGANKVKPQPDQAKLPLPPADPVAEIFEPAAGPTVWRLITEDDTPMAGAPDFPTKEAAEQWLAEFKAKAAQVAQPPAAEAPKLPEIKPFEDGFMVYGTDGNPMFGAKKFKTHDIAETALQKHLGIEQKKRAKEEKKNAPTLESATAEFKAAGTAAAKNQQDSNAWNKEWDAAASKHTDAFMEEHYDALHAAFKGGWIDGGGADQE